MNDNRRHDEYEVHQYNDRTENINHQRRDEHHKQNASERHTAREGLVARHILEHLGNLSYRDEDNFQDVCDLSRSPDPVGFFRCTRLDLVGEQVCIDQSNYCAAEHLDGKEIKGEKRCLAEESQIKLVEDPEVKVDNNQQNTERYRTAKRNHRLYFIQKNLFGCQGLLNSLRSQSLEWAAASATLTSSWARCWGGLYTVVAVSAVTAS